MGPCNTSAIFHVQGRHLASCVPYALILSSNLYVFCKAYTLKVLNTYTKMPHISTGRVLQHELTHQLVSECSFLIGRWTLNLMRVSPTASDNYFSTNSLRFLAPLLPRFMRFF